MTAIAIHQIFYDGPSRAMLDPGFIPLDNTANERPDWREYYPIRNFLLNTKLDDASHYGFLSPRFGERTGLHSAEVKDFVNRYGGADVILFSPMFDQGAFFVNTFEQGEMQRPGITQATQDALRDSGLNVDLRSLVCDSTSVVFCNYFVARPAFWRQWLGVCEHIYRKAEADPKMKVEGNDPLARDVPLKVLMIERIASVLLATQPLLRVAIFDPTSMPPSRSEAAGFPQEALVCDALKMSFRRLGNPKYMEQFMVVRSVVFRECEQRAAMAQARSGA